MCRICYDEGEGSTGTHYTVHAIESIAQNAFYFVTEDKEEEGKGSVTSIVEIDIAYPLADEPVYEMDLCAMNFPNSMKLLLNQKIWISDTAATVHATLNPSDMIKKSEKE
jgi:hypothetical protein